MSDRGVLDLPNRWQEIQPDKVYQSIEGRLVSFSKSQIHLGILYDFSGKHLKAIHKGLVSPKGSTGLVPFEESDYDFKSKSYDDSIAFARRCRSIAGIIAIHCDRLLVAERKELQLSHNGSDRLP
jgi:hypothetical protein